MVLQSIFKFNWVSTLDMVVSWMKYNEKRIFFVAPFDFGVRLLF